jgi:diguanylate cyclase (GGDEF)-like protein
MAQNHGAKGLALIRWIGLAMGLPALGAVIMLGGDAAVAIRHLDRIAFEREADALDRGVHLLGELHASEQMALTMWDDAFRNVVASRKPAWIKANFGRKAFAQPSLQQVLIVDPLGKAVFSSEFDSAPPADRAAAILTAVAPQMDRARALYSAAVAAGEGFGERQPGALTDGVYVSDVARIEGRPALITLSPFTPDIADVDVPEDPTLLLGIEFMGDAVLAKLSTMANLDKVSLVPASEALSVAAPSHGIRNAAGTTLAYATWSSAPPGTAVLHAAVPAIAASIALTAILTVVGAVLMRRLTRRLSDSEQAALYASRHDAATGLANRRCFMSVFERLLARSDKKESAGVVLLIDSDYFKTVNDTLGHAAGDAVLSAIAERLKGLSDRLSIAARLGGDEFAVVSLAIESRSGAPALMRSILEAIMRPVRFETHVINVSVSIGAAVFQSSKGGEIDDLLAKADMALYRAKRDGRGCARLYDPALDTGAMPELPSSRHPANDLSRVLASQLTPAKKAPQPMLETSAA